MNSNDRIIHLYSILSPGALYPMKLIKERYNDSYDNITKENLDSLGKSIRSECKRKTDVPLIIQRKIGTVTYYSLNEKVVSPDIETNQNQSVRKMVESLLKVVLRESRKNFEHWLNEDLMNVLQKLISEKVEKEFAEEILPILIQNIDSKIVKSTKITKDQFKTMLIDILDDGIKGLKGTINS